VLGSGGLVLLFVFGQMEGLNLRVVLLSFFNMMDHIMRCQLLSVLGRME
jgi:hypothetical protein